MTSLSNRQYPMLKAFAEAKQPFYMPIEEAQRYDQRPFRSMLVRKWISFKPGRGFFITPDGLDAWRIFFSTEIWRKNPSAPLTVYFEAAKYMVKKMAIVTHRKRTAA